MTDPQLDPGSPFFARATAAAIALLAQHGIEAEDARTLYLTALDALASEDPAKRAAARDLALTTIGPNEYLELADILRQLHNAARRCGSDSSRYYASVHTLFGSDAMRLAGLEPEPERDGIGSTNPDELRRLAGDRVILCPQCNHGIDPHGVDPGGRCGVGDAAGRQCECMMTPNGIAAALLARAQPSNPIEWIVCDRDYRELFRVRDFEVEPREDFRKVGRIVGRGETYHRDVMFAYPALAPSSPFMLVHSDVEVYHDGATLVTWTFEAMDKVLAELRHLGETV